MEMTNAFRDLLHRMTHRVPGVPAHADRPPVHHRGAAPRPTLNQRWNHSAARPPRFLPAWQHRVAAVFGRGR